ncbi:hypothetical protein ACPXCG_13495 [Gordonia sp. DT218]|uniref:hypothetical protein n=1 Tax=unclassified Gordonia (in: high G+C Gram-positive bacteria) TaxID=2657482 RepID=UPI003CF4C388
MTDLSIEEMTAHRGRRRSGDHQRTDDSERAPSMVCPVRLRCNGSGLEWAGAAAERQADEGEGGQILPEPDPRHDRVPR